MGIHQASFLYSESCHPLYNNILIYTGISACIHVSRCVAPFTLTSMAGLCAACMLNLCIQELHGRFQLPVDCPKHRDCRAQNNSQQSNTDQLIHLPIAYLKPTLPRNTSSPAFFIKIEPTTLALSRPCSTYLSYILPLTTDET